MNLFNLFKWKSSAPAAEPDYIQVQSYSGNTYHILHNTDRTGFSTAKNALCGYREWLRTNTMQEATVEQFSSDQRGYFWRYCSTCTDTLAQLEAGVTDLSLLPVKAGTLN